MSHWTNSPRRTGQITMLYGAKLLPTVRRNNRIAYEISSRYIHQSTPTIIVGIPKHARANRSPGQVPSLNGLCKHGIRTPPHIPMKVRGALPRSNRKLSPSSLPKVQIAHSLTRFTPHWGSESLLPREIISFPTGGFPHRGSHQIADQNHHIQV